MYEAQSSLHHFSVFPFSPCCSEQFALMCVCSCVPDLNIYIFFLTAGCLAFLTFRLFRAASTPITYRMYIFIFSVVVIMG